MAKLTPLAEEVDNLQLWEAEARQHVDEAERAFEALLAREQQDDEDAAKVIREQNELLQRDAETRQ